MIGITRVEFEELRCCWHLDGWVAVLGYRAAHGCLSLADQAVLPSRPDE